MPLNTINIYIETNTKNRVKKVHHLQSYIILKDNGMKECILKTVRVNGGHCGRITS